MPKLQDLIEFRYDHARKVFMKYQTHITNQPYAICAGKKQKIIANDRPSLYTRFVIANNGKYQYTNEFKPKKKKNENTNIQRTI